MLPIAMAAMVTVTITVTEWTAGGRLRHAAYVGLRDDKAASDVRRETSG